MYDVEKFRNWIKNWWVSLIVGLLFLACSVFVFLNQGESYLALAMTFGIMVIFAGVLEIYVGAGTPKNAGKGWLIAGGIIEILLGIILLCLPTLLLTTVPYFLGFWLMFRGFTTIGTASDMMGYGMKGAGWTLFLAIMMVLSSFVVLFNPIIGMGAAVLWLGISFLLAGITLIVFAFYLLRLKKHLR